MDEILLKSSAISTLLLPELPVSWSATTGKNFPVSDLLQYISVSEQLQVGGQSSIELRYSWNTQNRNNTIRQHILLQYDHTSMTRSRKGCLSKNKSSFVGWSRIVEITVLVLVVCL